MQHRRECRRSLFERLIEALEREGVLPMTPRQKAAEAAWHAELGAAWARRRCFVCGRRAVCIFPGSKAWGTAEGVITSEAVADVNVCLRHASPRWAYASEAGRRRLSSRPARAKVARRVGLPPIGGAPMGAAVFLPGWCAGAPGRGACVDPER